MNPALRSLLERYQPETAADWENVLREIVQELALLGLWRSKFFEHAAFYGGSALRIFHGLPRFSEDLDFSLLRPWNDFELDPHLEAVRTELAGFGFAFDVEKKVKQVETAMESAFLKGNTRVNLLEIGAPAGVQFPANQKLKIKLEVDTKPPLGGADEVQTLLIPIPFQVRLYRLSSLFAGKLHAVLCRKWKSRVKGRDFFDFVWYIGKRVPVHLGHLRRRMEQTGHWDPTTDLNEPALKTLLRERVKAVDFEQAKRDVLPFLSDPDAVSLWGPDFFLGLIDRLTIEGG